MQQLAVLRYILRKICVNHLKHSNICLTISVVSKQVLTRKFTRTMFNYLRTLHFQLWNIWKKNFTIICSTKTNNIYEIHCHLQYHNKLFVHLKSYRHSLSFQAILIPLPPPPAEAFTITGYPE